MKAFVKNISSDEFDLEVYEPEDPYKFCLTLRIQIGLDTTNGADDFDLTIYTPKWLEEVIFEAEWGRGTLIVKNFNFFYIKKFINDYVLSCEGDNWDGIAMQLNKVFVWEFDNYKNY